MGRVDDRIEEPGGTDLAFLFVDCAVCDSRDLEEEDLEGKPRDLTGVSFLSTAIGVEVDFLGVKALLFVLR